MVRRTVLVLIVLLWSKTLAADPVVSESLTQLSFTAAPADAAADVTAVHSYLEWFFQHTNGRQLKKARQYVAAVVQAAHKEDLDPLLLAITISHESTWRVAVEGKIGEVGLMQVHGEAARGFEVSTVEGNLAAGARWLASRIQKYGSLQRGLAAYMGDGERARRAAKWRLDAYLKECRRQGRQPRGVQPIS